MAIAAVFALQVSC